MATPDTAHVEFSVPADVLSADGPFVVKDVPVLFRAGKYDFPEEDGGAFEMTADDIRAALEKVPPEGVPITNEHNKRCWFKGKLGRFVPSPPAGDYSKFGGKAEFPLPVVQLSGPGPYGLSANFRRADKTLQDVSLTWSPRIEGAAAFAAYAAFAKSEGSAVETTPHGKARMQMLHDTAAEGGALCKGAEAKKKFGSKADDAGMSDTATFTSQHERDAMQAVHDTAAGMGATCNVSSDSKAKKKGDEAMAAYSQEFGPPPSPEVKALQAQLATLLEERAAEKEAAKKASEAHFSATVASFASQAETFADSLRERLLPYQRPLCVADYCRSAEDDLRQPAEVHFSTADGKAHKGTRLELCKARWQSLPPHGLTSEGVKARAGAEALFAANDGPKSEQERAVAEAKQYAEAWGKRNGKG